MRKLIFLLITLFVSANLFAQLEVKKDSFKEVPGFVNINTDKMYDDNDKPYAVLKIKTENIDSKQRRELNFGGDAQTYYEVEYKEGEVWLYISYYATFIKIYHEELSSAEFYFPFDIQPKKGYELTLVNKAVPVSSGWASLTIQTKPENGAKILLNGRDLNAVTPYMNNMLAAGKYEITVSKNKFETTTQTVDIQDGDNKIVEIEMPYQYGKLYVDGVFSVSPDKKVKFSQGNLQYQASTNTWRFAEHQWDIIGDGNKNISSIYNGWIDLLGWGTGNAPTNISKINNDYSSFSDWGNEISNGRGMNNTDMYNASFSSNKITQSDWTSRLEANGAVFLPVAGWRYGTNVKHVASHGYYWSATYSDSDYAYGVYFNDGYLYADSFSYRELGQSVRLVCDAE